MSRASPSITTSPTVARLPALPLAPIVVLALIAFTPYVHSNQTLIHSVWLAALVLLIWYAVLFVRSGSARAFALRVEVRPQHYVQALVQLSVYAYWGYYWRTVYDHAWLIFAQLAFAYAFDMLLTWTRRDTYSLGFGAFPIVFSTNLFLFFKDDWFYLQFVVIAVGLMGKEFVRWQRDGRSVHIFNPSAFTLALFAIVLIATGTTDITWAQSIATTLTLAPHFYIFMFAVGLVVMYFFAITPITACAAATLFALSALYSAITGVPYFIDSEIPAAVFLGMHLLVTDPSTTPRTPLGKAIFGVLYGLGVFVLFSLLGAIGAPTFYDKLLCVPLLNLSVQRIDRWVNSHPLPRGEGSKANPLPLGEGSKAGEGLPFLSSNLAHMSLWILFFGSMTAFGKTDGMQRGDSVPFWNQACAENRVRACERLLQIEASYCSDKSAWACNELGVHYATQSDPALAEKFFGRACELRFEAACTNLLGATSPVSADPKPLDLRLLLRERGLNLMDMPPADLYARACKHDWKFACTRQASLR